MARRMVRVCLSAAEYAQRGAGSVEMAAAGLSPEGQLLLLGAMLIVAAVFAPWATAAALRISSE